MRMFRIVTSAAVLKSMTKISHYRLGHYAGLVATMLLTPVLWAEDCRSISGTVPDTADPFPATWGIDVANTTPIRATPIPIAFKLRAVRLGRPGLALSRDSSLS